MRRLGLLALLVSGLASAQGVQYVRINCPGCALTQGSLTLSSTGAALVFSGAAPQITTSATNAALLINPNGTGALQLKSGNNFCLDGTGGVNCVKNASGVFTLFGVAHPTIAFDVGNDVGGNQRLNFASTSSVVYSNVADGAGAIGVKLGQANALSTTGAKALALYSDVVTTEILSAKKESTGWYLESVFGFDANAAAALHIGDVNASQIIIGAANVGSSGISVGNSTTTIPVKVAGGSGAFVGTCAMAAGTTCTATVPTGAKCVAAPQAGTTSVSAVAVVSTTVTVTASASNSNTYTIICL